MRSRASVELDYRPRRERPVAQALGNVSVTPTTYLLYRSGRIVATYVGEPGLRDFHARIERTLAEPA